MELQVPVLILPPCAFVLLVDLYSPHVSQLHDVLPSVLLFLHVPQFYELRGVPHDGLRDEFPDESRGVPLILLHGVLLGAPLDVTLGELQDVSLDGSLGVVDPIHHVCVLLVV